MFLPTCCGDLQEEQPSSKGNQKKSGRGVAVISVVVLKTRNRRLAAGEMAGSARGQRLCFLLVLTLQ